MESSFIQSVIEALIMASPEPLPARKISAMLENTSTSDVNKAVAELNNRYMESGSSFRVRELAGGFQFYIMPEFTGYVEEMFARTRKMRLTRASLETLAIIAYKQPVTKTDIEQIRGVASDGVLQNLLEKNMITITGRAETVGKPLQYGTTDEFLKFFGINSIKDLPKMSEIEAMVAAVDKENQQDFTLETEHVDGTDIIKLNIDDGSYAPENDIIEETLDEPSNGNGTHDAETTSPDSEVIIERDDTGNIQDEKHEADSVDSTMTDDSEEEAVAQTESSGNTDDDGVIIDVDRT